MLKVLENYTRVNIFSKNIPKLNFGILFAELGEIKDL